MTLVAVSTVHAYTIEQWSQIDLNCPARRVSYFGLLHVSKGYPLFSDADTLEQYDNQKVEYNSNGKLTIHTHRPAKAIARVKHEIKICTVLCAVQGATAAFLRLK